MNLKRKKGIIFLCIFTAGVILAGEEENKTLVLELGNPSLKHETMDIFPEKLYSAQTGQTTSFEKMIKDMQNNRLIYVGETHNSLPMHKIQAQIILALFEQERNLSIGMEMLNREQQEIVNKWTLGILSEVEFIQQARWYVNWNFNFGFYKEIFSLAKNNHIPIHLLNVPREIITKIRMQGWDALSDEQKKMIPKPDLSHQEHRTLIRTIFADMGIHPAMGRAGLDKIFESFYRAQSAWDEVMAANALESSQRHQRRMVILAGSGHLLYNLGINRRAFEKKRWPFSTVICVAIPAGTESVPVARSLADYIWGIRAEERPAFPTVGLRFRKFSGLDNPVVERTPIDGVALEAGIEKGDVILGINSKKFTDINELNMFLSQFEWGDEVMLSILRNAQKKNIRMKFQVVEK